MYGPADSDTPKSEQGAEVSIGTPSVNLECHSRAGFSHISESEKKYVRMLTVSHGLRLECSHHQNAHQEGKLALHRYESAGANGWMVVTLVVCCHCHRHTQSGNYAVFAELFIGIYIYIVRYDAFKRSTSPLLRKGPVALSWKEVAFESGERPVKVSSKPMPLAFTCRPQRALILSPNTMIRSAAALEMRDLRVHQGVCLHQEGRGRLAAQL